MHLKTSFLVYLLVSLSMRILHTPPLSVAWPFLFPRWPAQVSVGGREIRWKISLDVGSGCMFRVPWGKWEKQFACTTGLPHDQAVRFTKLKRVNLELQLSAHTEYA